MRDQEKDKEEVLRMDRLILLTGYGLQKEDTYGHLMDSLQKADTCIALMEGIGTIIIEGQALTLIWGITITKVLTWVMIIIFIKGVEVIAILRRMEGSRYPRMPWVTVLFITSRDAWTV